MKRILLFFILVLNTCITVDENYEGKTKPIPFSVCFWRAENLNSKKVISWTGKKNPLSEVVRKCDAISLTDVKADNVNLSIDLEELFHEDGLKYTCLDSVLRLDEGGRIISKSKYTTCVNNDLVIEMKLMEYPEARNDFSSPQSFFFLELINGTKVSILPFHAIPGNRNELIDFERIVNFAYQKYSERKTFFGGDFYIDKKYHSEAFLKSLLYFRILKNLISTPTTIAGERNDAIFTDNITRLNCSGSVHQVNQVFPELNTQKISELISSHLPVVALCKLK